MTVPRWALSSAPTSAAAAAALDGAVHVTLIWNLLCGWVVGCLQLVSDAGICSTLCRWSDVSYIIKSLCSEHGRISASSFFLLLWVGTFLSHSRAPLFSNAFYHWPPEDLMSAVHGALYAATITDTAGCTGCLVFRADLRFSGEN